jgi:hypothetical protein
MNTPVIRPTVAESVTVTTSWPHVATVAAVEAITESKKNTVAGVEARCNQVNLSKGAAVRESGGR